MQLKKIALAVLAAVATVPAFAEIKTGQLTNTDFGGAEFVLVAWNNAGSFVKDLGITTTSFEALMNTTHSFSASVAGSTEYAKFLGLGGVNTQWAMIATNPIGLGQVAGEVNAYTTTRAGQAANGISNQAFNDGAANLMYVFKDNDNQAFNATHVAANNVEFAAKNDSVAYVSHDYIKLGGTYGTSSAVGVKMGMNYLTSATDGGDDPVVAATFVNNTLEVKFDGTTLTAVTAVPEPSTYALLLAGLCAVGFVARRRQA